MGKRPQDLAMTEPDTQSSTQRAGPLSPETQEEQQVARFVCTSSGSQSVRAPLPGQALPGSRLTEQKGDGYKVEM